MIKDDTDNARDLILSGTELAGAAVGGAMGFFAGGPGSAALLSTSGVAIARVLSLTAEKYLAKRERKRVGSVAAIAADHIRNRVANGDTFQHHLFQSNHTDSSDGAQLLEGVLLKARDAYEERKLPFLGYYSANVLFEPELGISVAFHMLQSLERLSYRQILLLSLLEEGPLDMEWLRSNEHTAPELETLKREEMDLHANDLGNLGLVGGIGSWVDTLSPMGSLLARLANFAHTPQSDKDDLLKILNHVEERAP